MKPRNNEEQNNKQDLIIAVIHEKVGKIEKWIDNADVNHFPTIEKRFDKIENKIAYWAGMIMVVGALAQIIINYFNN